MCKMEKVSKIQFYISALFSQVMESKKSLLLYNELSNHILYAKDTRNLIMNSLFRNAIIQIASVIKKDCDSVNIIKIQNHLENKQDIAFLRTKVGDNTIKEIASAIKSFRDSHLNENDIIIAWRDKYYAHLDKGWYDNDLLKTKTSYITIYDCTKVVDALEKLFHHIYKKLNWEIPEIFLEQDIEKFMEIIKVGEKSLN